MTTRKQKILVIRTSALGDVAMTLPVVYSVARKYPDTDFYVLTRPLFAKLFIGRPANLHIIEADLKGRHRGIKGLWRLVRQLNSMRFSAVADLHNILRSWVIDIDMMLHGARVAMVDKKRLGRLGKNIRKRRRNFIDRYADVFSRLGYPVSLTFDSIFTDGIPPENTPIDHPAVGIAPFARYANKTYPVKNMQQVIKTLNDAGVHVYLFGARGEEEAILDSWAAQSPLTISLAGKTDIISELALMSRMDLMVTMDSANHHLASIVGTRVISIWGSTMPCCGFNGYRQDPDDALFAHLDCQPCTVAGSEKCRRGDFACMHQLLPEKVSEKILKALGFAINRNRQ